MGRPTIDDVAKLAGVSKSAVSFYLNGKAKRYHLSDALIEKIKDAIKSSNYIPNFHARAIGLKKTFLVGVISTNPGFESFWNEILSGIEQVFKEHDYHMLLGLSSTSIEKEREIFDFMLRKGVDGIIYHPTMAPDGSISPYPLKIAKDIPVVSILLPSGDLPSVHTDIDKGGELAARHLYEMGHTKIAYIGTLSTFSRHPDNCRFNGAETFLGAKGIRLMPFADIPSFFSRRKEFTAVFCFSDLLAGQLYKKCQIEGVEIPRELSIVGFDNMGFISLLHPELTTIDQAKRAIGEEAAKLILRRISAADGESADGSVVFTPELKRGASVAKLPLKR